MKQTDEELLDWLRKVQAGPIEGLLGYRAVLPEMEEKEFVHKCKEEFKALDGNRIEPLGVAGWRSCSKDTDVIVITHGACPCCGNAILREIEV